MSKGEKVTKLLLTSVFGPYGVENEYADGVGCQMELLNNQVTREQGVHSPRQSYLSSALYLLAENISIPTTVLDFPKWEDFTEELKKGYSHVGISFIVANVLKAKRMAEYIRENYPKTKIILGGYGTTIPDIKNIVPCDEVCEGEGVRWLREYFGENPNAPIKHPAIPNPIFEYIYGYKTNPKGSIILPGLGCENACNFCATSHKFGKKYIPLLETGEEIFNACLMIENKIGARGFIIMDENFLKHPSRAAQLLSEMEKHNKPYLFDIFASAEVVKKFGADFLLRLGVRMLWIGVESKRNNIYKKTEGIDIPSLIKELRSKGIMVIASVILFLDHHDKTTIQEEIDWAISLGSDLIQFMEVIPFPNTTLYNNLKSEGKLLNVPYRRIHGQDELCFEHPYFKDRKEHKIILKNAFEKKYKVDGPGIVNMAFTAAQGYKQAIKDYEEREKNGICWNPQALCYEKSDSPKPDEFMKGRIRMMRRVALKLRPILLSAKVFAPNSKTREKCNKTISLYNEIFGKPTIKDWIKSFVVLGTATIEATRIKICNLLGKNGIIRQPPTNRIEYPKIKIVS